MQYLFVKHSHITFVVITLILFNLRFWLRYAKPERILPGWLRGLPHINDTFLLFTGLWLMKITHFMPFGNANWLGVKLLLVLCYIIGGAVTLRAAPRSSKACIGYVACMAIFLAIVYLARLKPF